MRGVVDYSIITAASAHRPHPAPGTLAGKLTVTAGHPASYWLLAQVATQFSHACVENAAALNDHALAVTVSGTVKQRGNHYRKDDRPEVTSPSSWILGGNAAAKSRRSRHEIAEPGRPGRQDAAAAEASLDERGSEPPPPSTRRPSWPGLHLLETTWTTGPPPRAAEGLAGSDRRAQGRQREPATAAGHSATKPKEHGTQLVGACEKPRSAITDGMPARKETLAGHAAGSRQSRHRPRRRPRLP